MNKQDIKTHTVKPEVDFFYNEELYRLIDANFETSLDNHISELENYMKDNPGTGCTEEEKDQLYLTAQNMLKEYQNELRDANFNFHLNRPQYRFLTDLLLKKMEYDVNQLFVAIELTDLLGSMKGTKFTDDVELKCFTLTATNIVHIYHLISEHKVKGLTNDTYTFSKILLKIGELSGLINYYDTTAKNFVDDISRWAMEFSPVEVGEAVPPKDKTLYNAETGEVVVGEESESTD